MDTSSATIIKDAMAKYCVGSSYAEAYLNYWTKANNRAFASLTEILEMPQPHQRWYGYAMSALQRGRKFYSAHQDEFPASGKRYLDVGCGFGGFLVAFAEHGYDVTGVEIDPVRVELSRANCRDLGKGEVIEGSILDDALIDRLGRFDVITCNDVIEHVLDVPKTIHHMVKLLNPGGVLLLEIPNRDFLGSVAADDHYSLHGITQLERDTAIEYFRHFWRHAYDIGDYYQLSHYQNLFQAEGCESHLLKKRVPYVTIMRRFLKYYLLLQRSRSRFRREVTSQLPLELSARIEESVRLYRNQLIKNLPRAIYRPQEFCIRYLMPVWNLVAKRPSELGR